MTDTTTPAPLTADERAGLRAWLGEHAVPVIRTERALVHALLATVDAAEQRVSYAEAERDSARHLHACSGARERTALDTADRLHDALTAERAARERAEQLLTDLTPGGPEYANPARCFDYVRDELLRRQALTVQLERERDEVSRHHVSCTMTVVEREADLRAKLDEARAWSGLWKFAAKRIRLRERTLDRITDTMERERDAARAQVAALRAAIAPIFAYHEEGEQMREPDERAGGDVIGRVNDVALRRSDLAVLRAVLRAALATAPAAHTCREPALREATQPFVEVCEALLALPQHAAPVATIIGVGEAKITPDDVARLRAALATPPAAHVCRELALRAAIEYVVDGLEHQSLIDVEAADYLRAALATAPAAHTCREPALREALDRIAGQRHVDCCPVETGDEARRIARAALGAAFEEPAS